MQTMIAATTDAVSVSELTAMRTVAGVDYLVAAVGLAGAESVQVYILVGTQWVRLVNRATEEEVALQAHIPQVPLTGGPVYGFAKDETVAAVSVVGWT